jgi:hypothetical protein
LSQGHKKQKRKKRKNIEIYFVPRAQKNQKERKKNVKNINFVPRAQETKEKKREVCSDNGL